MKTMKIKFVDSHRSKGFTLIELLIVVAIIGILAATILASLGGARKQGIDASIKTTLSNLRSQAELYATGNNFSYNGLCTEAASNNDSKVDAMLKDLVRKTDSSSVVCNSERRGWAASVKLQAEDGYWCVDSDGNSLKINSSVTVTACPLPSPSDPIDQQNPQS